jgi:iron only hydrogenase large subunit-like protein
MLTLNELYGRLLKSAAENEGQIAPEELEKGDFDEHHLQCLLHPESCAAVIHSGECDCKDESGAPCVRSCLFGAITRDEGGKVVIDPELCTGCSECIRVCKSGRLSESRDVLPALYALKNSKGPVYALIAPAFIGQFSESVTPGKLRSAFKKLGFAGMVEVALFADILTLKEALEFDKMVPQKRDFQLASCCCPVWIAMIRKVHSQFLSYVPGSVSPMVASGRAIKQLEKGATTIFIGPCIAKKSEAREKDVADAVDFVLTFEEVRDIFSAFDINPAEEPEDDREHSSRAGRIYARTAGVSEAVQSTVERLSPDRKVAVSAVQADGIPACKQLFADLRDGKVSANFIEGMGCVGGCVGGPKAILKSEIGRDNVNRYGDEAEQRTPLDSPQALALLNRLGLETVEELLEDTRIFTRHFD